MKSESYTTTELSLLYHLILNRQEDCAYSYVSYIHNISCWSSINVVFLFKVVHYTLRHSSKISSKKKLWRPEASGFRRNPRHLNKGFIYVPLMYKDFHSSFQHAYVQWNLRTCDINKTQWSIQFRVWISCKRNVWKLNHIECK